ncbi:toll/interleukin-1 receptor domain-containing protein [Tichowtungia aerotolerans]|uniref:TIR domain-containing protein n=1 Tax=Tichowtungia aerotolerans TaxID=2697043 RepID=A0A6P1M784_9BACT|nr:toll/interleukin-1 receptor domain-containing protein [Tichowtungia aerotolerans]QHI68048.1 TIR domain-containing protein [Tichowtungia aerotolerans]
MAEVFFSYTHRDETMRDELEVHLTMLKRQGLIEAWHDRRIGAGNEFDRTISAHLESADIILLLVSPHFLASEYCYEREMARAMERHEAGETRVVPVILEPCDWHPAPFGKLLAVPIDGKPVSKFVNQNDGLLEVAQAVRSAIEEMSPASPSSTVEIMEAAEPIPAVGTNVDRSSNLRLKKTFTDQERDEFLESTFEYITRYFENSLEELRARNSEISTRFKRIDAIRFTSIIYMGGQSASECTVRLGGLFGNGISYSSDANADNNSCNDSMSIAEDGYSLFMKPMGMTTFGHQNELLSPEGAAEYFWNIFIERLQ